LLKYQPLRADNITFYKEERLTISSVLTSRSVSGPVQSL
jgi:hypothetical protein